MALNLQDFNDHYEYKYDVKGRDRWHVLKQDPDGAFRGDCEDYALSVLYYVVCQESWLKFWWMLFTFQAELCGCDDKNGQGHAVLRYGDIYIDNWTKEWVSRDGMEVIGHNFHPWYLTILPTTVALKMLWAKLKGRN